MIDSLLAFALLVLPLESLPLGAARGPVLQLAPCVDVDQAVIGSLVELELRDIRDQTTAATIAVTVSCADDHQEIRVEPWATSYGEEGVRALHLPAAADDTPAAHEARSRELALAIAELIRRLQTLHPLTPPPPEPSPAGVPPPPPPDPPEPVPSPGPWHLGLAASGERFARGLTFFGGDGVLGRSWGSWLFGEARLGLRLSEADVVPAGRLTSRAATASLAIGPALGWSRGRSALALIARLQGYVLDARLADGAGNEAQSRWAGAVVATAGPLLVLGLGRHVTLRADAGLGLPLHGVVMRVQGSEASSLAGLLVSGSLGASLRF